MTPLSATFYALSMRLYDLLHQGAQESAREGARRRGHSLLVTSARPGEGKTYIARIIARYMAELSSDQVLLVDGNLENAALHREFGIQNTAGLSDALVSARPESAIVQPTATPNLMVMAVGNTLKPAVLFKSENVHAFLDYYCRRFGIVIIDGGPLGSCGSLAHQSDRSIMVVDSSSTRREVIQGVMAQANVDRSKYLGAVLNKRMLYIPPSLYKRF